MLQSCGPRFIFMLQIYILPCIWYLNKYNYEEINSNTNDAGECVDNYTKIILGVDYKFGDNYEKYLELFNKVYSMCNAVIDIQVN